MRKRLLYKIKDKRDRSDFATRCVEVFILIVKSLRGPDLCALTHIDICTEPGSGVS